MWEVRAHRHEWRLLARYRIPSSATTPDPDAPVVWLYFCEHCGARREEWVETTPR